MSIRWNADYHSTEELDLTKGILGVQGSQNASCLVWPSGHKMVVPFLSDSKGKNLLHNNEYYLHQLHSMAILTPAEGSEVIHVLEHDSKAQVQCNIINVLDSGRCILIENAYDTTDFELMPESLGDEYSVPPLMEVNFHGECGHHLHCFR